MINLTINGKHIGIIGEYYGGYISRDREQPNEPAEYIIQYIKLIDDYDEITADYFNNSLEFDEQLAFLDTDEYQLGELCLELIEEMKAEHQIDDYLEYYESRI